MNDLVEKIVNLFKESNLNSEEFNYFEFVNFDKSKFNRPSKLKDVIDITVRKNISNDDYKLIEITKWNNDIDKFCVILGFNPTELDINEIDNTNVKLINELEKDYGGVILLNYHILRSKTKEEFSPQDDWNVEYNHEILPKILKLLIEEKIEVVIFWGRTNSFENDIYDLLKQLQENEKLKYTVKKDTESHYHPGRCEIKIKSVDATSFATSNYLK